VIEGIGGNFGLTAALVTPFENHERLLCFTHHDSIVWINPAVPGDPMCSLSMAVADRPLPPEGVVVSPMPFTDAFEVRMPADAALATYRIFMASGQLVMEGTLHNGGSLALDAPAGCYHLELSDRGGSILARQRLIKL
jgi:hypothetical protein